MSQENSPQSNPASPPDLAKVRAEIDRVDSALLDLISERLALSADVRRAKSGARLWRPSREDSHVAELVKRAEMSQTPASLVSRIWAELMSASISVQGSTRLYVSLEGDVQSNVALIRDRFGGSLPLSLFPTSSAALSACYRDPEGIAILPAPGGMQNWWAALAPDGAMSDMKIVAALPRISDQAWPKAVAVAVMGLDLSIPGRALRLFDRTGSGEAANVSEGVLRAQTERWALYDGVHDGSPSHDGLGSLPCIGYLPHPIPLTR